MIVKVGFPAMLLVRVPMGNVHVLKRGVIVLVDECG